MLASLMLLAAATTPLDRDAQQAKLQALLDQHNYAALNAEFDAPDSAERFRADLDWLGSAWFRGDGVYVSFAYARMLRIVAANMPADQQDELRTTALSALAYAAAVASVDGAVCADRSAPEHRVQQAVQAIRESGLHTLGEPQRGQAGAVALALEKKTWATRQQRDDSRFLCSGGMEQMSFNLSHGAKVEERPRKPGEIGRQMAVSDAAGYTPGVLPRERWLPIAEARHAELARTIRSITALPATYDLSLDAAAGGK